AARRFGCGSRAFGAAEVPVCDWICRESSRRARRHRCRISTFSTLSLGTRRAPPSAMDEGPESAPSALRLRPALVIAMVLMVFWLAAYWRFADLDWPLFQLSWSGPRALALYVTGHYRDAARAYRHGQRGALRVAYENDPSGYRAFRARHLDEAERRARTTLAL